MCCTNKRTIINSPTHLDHMELTSEMTMIADDDDSDDDDGDDETRVHEEGER